MRMSLSRKRRQATVPTGKVESKMSFLDKATTLEEAVFQALGAASVCWENIDKAGVFKSERARDIGMELLEWIDAHQGWAPKNLNEASM